jgi:hypothetical protein
MENAHIFLGMHPASNGELEGGRNPLLESAQQVTLPSVATAAFSRQSSKTANHPTMRENSYTPHRKQGSCCAFPPLESRHPEHSFLRRRCRLQ